MEIGYVYAAKNKDDEDEDKDKDDAGARAPPLLTSRPLKQGLLMAAGEDIQIFVHVLKYTKSNINRTFPNLCRKEFCLSIIHKPEQLFARAFLHILQGHCAVYSTHFVLRIVYKAMTIYKPADSLNIHKDLTLK